MGFLHSTNFRACTVVIAFVVLFSSHAFSKGSKPACRGTLGVAASVFLVVSSQAGAQILSDSGRLRDRILFDDSTYLRGIGPDDHVILFRDHENFLFDDSSLLQGSLLDELPRWFLSHQYVLEMDLFDPGFHQAIAELQMEAGQNGFYLDYVLLSQAGAHQQILIRTWDQRGQFPGPRPIILEEGLVRNSGRVIPAPGTSLIFATPALLLLRRRR